MTTPAEGTPTTGPAVAVVGECVADAFADPGASRRGELALRVIPGGGPANAAVALARLGTPARYLGRISADPFGRLFHERLTASGVDLSGVVRAAEPSTLAVATLDAEGRAEYSFHAEGTADWQWTAEELATRDLGGVAAVHTGSLALVMAPGAARIEEFLAGARAGATISIDPNVRPGLVDPAVYRARLPRWAALADIVKVSEEDLDHLGDFDGFREECHAAGARLVLLTRGADGVTASLDGVRLAVPAPAVNVTDTVGAGDAFTAGLLHRLGARGLLGGRLTGLTAGDLSEALAFAVRVAALTCEVAGADPPWHHQLAAPAPLTP
ncbi:carbohydrate kinase family protein [Streptosporangium pseudovulgare]|uniref:Fructokinase n=1 Tax=Streptosporangium pseudovulgare TaxID=35765 RepID=A0ABQ2QPN3_9ACTN|nr:carbohydrate kinase [Streptosporangium pseudovulgare]GGP87891.1 fructokinase [Streptosporangium pseudovulgare]